jgi:chromosome segregation protein
VYLKSVTVKGFKSFPDRTKLEFGPGVSVIVGPNGSGKSNVTDAVLWALGEQSPVAVRGQSMQDVIFGGAPGRKAASTAEVELVLDDSEQSLGLGVSEISVVRRLDRSGEGEYRLAGARCRLIDVIELLSDTGLGKEMHSVISQGRVESLVTSKPRERRLLIEEAAGLGKHRKRRRRAQLKLERTHDNLDRALDVEREARSRLRPLKRQAEAAELHERLERQALEIRWELVRDAVRARGVETDGAQAATEQVRAQRAELATQLETVGASRQQAEEALAARSAQREELSRRAYTARAAGERIGYRSESVAESRARVVQRLEQSRQLIATLREQSDTDHENPEAVARIAALESELEALQRDREAELARQLEALQAKLTSADGAIEATERVVATALDARRAAERGTENARGAIREAERGAEQARREAARVGGELAAVNQFLRNHAGAINGATSLSDSLDVAPGHELAVAAALDGRLTAAVVEATAEGSALLDRAGDDGGRALVSGAAPPDETPTAPPVPGAERLLEHVRGDEATLAVVARLLADTWVVDDLADCADGFTGIAVTRAGRVWSAGTRELRQAPAVGEDRVLAQRNRREQLVSESERAAQAELKARDAVQRAAAAASEADAERDRLIAEHRAAVRAHDEAVEERRRIAAQIDRRRSAPDDGAGAERRAQLTAQIAAERSLLERAARERDERRRRLAQQQASVTRDEALIPQIDEALSALRECATAVGERHAEFEAALATDREAGEQAATQLRECAQQEAALHARMSTCNESLTAAEIKLERSRDHLREARAELSDIADRLELAPDPATEPLDDEQRETMTARLERIRRRREQLGPVNPLAQEEYAEALEHVEELEAQRTDLESSLRELQKLIADIDRQIRETFEQTFAATATAFEELATQLFPGGKGRLTLVAEPDRAGRPASVIGGQPLPDSDADERTETSPEESGNGAAGDGPAAEAASDEERGDGEQAGEELDGVEIEITPAGKDPKRLSLLSGGEKSMTALAFLFAVFLARPCPFYILDEVEAALDDLNITRFLTLLAQYSSRAQFIVVTHQKRTMEAADSLYGVSMGSDGISKVISRRLPPAEQQAA